MWMFVVLVLLFSNKIIFGECCRLWEVEGVKIEDVEQYDVGIVLTGMASYNNDLERMTVGKAADRVWQAMNLYHAGRIDKILITGHSGDVVNRGLDEANQLKHDLINWGLPEEDLIIENEARNTHENAAFTTTLLRSKYPELETKLLITSAQHMRRARACFEKEGLIFDEFTTDHMTGLKRTYFVEQFILPSASTLSNWEGLMKEWVGYMVYDMVGYL